VLLNIFTQDNPKQRVSYLAPNVICAEAEKLNRTLAQWESVKEWNSQITSICNFYSAHPGLGGRVSQKELRLGEIIYCSFAGKR
jgi:hypothetical protein